MLRRDLPEAEQTLDQYVTRTIEMLGQADRPVLLAGNGIRMAGANCEFLQLVERWQVPVLTSWLGMDLIPESHELFVGRPGSIAPRGANFALQNSDLLIVLGCRMDMGLTGYDYARFARAAKKVIVDVDPAEIGKIKTRVNVPACCDVGAFLRTLLFRCDVPSVRTARSG